MNIKTQEKNKSFHYEIYVVNETKEIKQAERICVEVNIPLMAFPRDN